MKKILRKLLPAVLICIFVASGAGCSKKGEKNNIKPLNRESGVATTFDSVEGSIAAQNKETDSSFEKKEQPAKTTEAVKTDSTYELYKNFFYRHYTSEDMVYLLDVTHDGKSDMIAIGRPENENLEIHIYTVVNGKITEIYMMYLVNSRIAFYATKKSGTCNLVEDANGVYQGSGGRHYREFYLSQSGDAVCVKTFSQQYGKPSDAESFIDYDVAEALYNEKVAQIYGKNFSDLYLVFSKDDVPGSNKKAWGSTDFQTDPSVVFSK